MSGSLGIAPGFAGFAATPQGQAQYMAYAENPFKFLQHPADVNATVEPQSLATGGDVSGTTNPLFAQWQNAGILPANSSQQQTTPSSPGIDSQNGGGRNGLAPPSSSSGAGMSLDGMMPNTSTVGEATGVNPHVLKGVMSLVSMLAPPVGMALSAGNEAGNIGNTIANAGMLGRLGIPPSIGQELAGSLGFGTLPGMGAMALNGAMNTPEGRAALSQPQAQGMLPGVSMPTEGTAPVGQVTSESLSGNQPSGRSGGISSNGGAPGGGIGQSNGGGGEYAVGGVIKEPGHEFFAKKLAHGSGLVHGLSSGRADKISMKVPKGGYVLPADVVSGLGQGNTMAGGKSLSTTFKALKMPALANGGRVQGADVKLSAGEYFVHPHHVAALGDGDMNAGSAKLDALVQQVRGAVVQHATTAPHPA